MHCTTPLFTAKPVPSQAFYVTHINLLYALILGRVFDILPSLYPVIYWTVTQ